ncbi:MAG: acireductone synthase [Gammaproteobacteria bacterium]|nr:acireductone synthase [Gammaproteobacteria bacterium]
MIKAVLTDIEGTTTSLSFVHEVLFPMRGETWPGLSGSTGMMSKSGSCWTGCSSSSSAISNEGQIIDLLDYWMQEDRKETVLKSLQGLMWRTGYENGDFTGHVYEDAARNLRTWHEAGMELAVFSSGSVAAQKLLFRHSDFGDLTPLFSHYFDTTIGTKREAGAYKKIATTMYHASAEILFLSDVVEELNAARAAGMQTTQLIRDGQAAGDHPVAASFDEIALKTGN